jgi:hypothetical protein
MEPHVHREDASVQHDAAAHAKPVTPIGQANAAGLFYAACSRDYAEDICGCPICRQAAQDRQ